MRENEAAARNLVVDLRAAGIDANVTGAGVHWQVKVTAAAERGLVIHCFWYERAISGLVLGTNPSNARRQLGRAPTPREGPEYLVILESSGDRVADGRTPAAPEVVACARTWAAGGELEEIVHVTPFIDRGRRSMRSFAQRLDSRLRLEGGTDPAHDLWVYGDGRSCQINVDERSVACAFFIGQAQVAYSGVLEDVPAAVAAWLLSGVPLRELPACSPGVEIERHAEMLEIDPAHWHWLHVRDRVASQGDVLRPLHDLIEVLAQSTIASRFYSFSSLNRFCFSASSHYPWVNRELPVIGLTPEGVHVVDDTPCDRVEAVARIEATLSAYPIRPFFGSAPHYETSLLAACFAAQRSPLVPKAVQRGAWYELVVGEGDRRCTVTDGRVTFYAPMRTVARAYASLDDAARDIRRYLEDNAALDDLVT